MGSSDSPSSNEEDLKKYQGHEGVVTRWLKEHQLVDNSEGQQNYVKYGEKASEIYRSQSASKKSNPIFNVLWSTVQVLKPTYYWRMPKVVVERMHKDASPIARLACIGAERCTSYMLKTQQDRFNFAIKSSVEDLLLSGRGQVWLRYDAEFEEETDENGEPILDENEIPIQFPKPNSEKVVVDYVPWKDYKESLSRNPYETRWRSRKLYLTRAQLIKRFPHCGAQVELNHNTGKKNEKFTPAEQEFLAQAEVLEIEDLESKQTIWISEGYRQAPLDIIKDRYRLKDFFCSPVPLLGTTTSDSTHPTAFYKTWEKLAEELEYTLERLGAMVDCVRFVGATASAFHKDIKEMLKLKDGELWPVDNFANFAQAGGFKGVMDWLPFDQAVGAIPVLAQHCEYLLAKIYEVTGIPDIIRGTSDPNEPLGTTKQKLRWVSIKVEEKQQNVQRFCREIISKMAEIIFEPGLFSDETINLMAGVAQMSPEDQQMWPEALQLLRDDRLRTFEVGIETDSTIAVDEAEDKAARMEYIAALNQLLGNVEAVKQFGPEFVGPMIESALFAVRGFRTGRPLEGAWERTLKEHEDNLKAMKENPPPPPPDYGMMELQLKSQDLQLKAQEMQANFEIDSQKIQVEYAKINAQMQGDAVDAQLDQFKQQFTQWIETQKLELDQFLAISTEREKLIEERRLALDERVKAMESEKKAPQPVNVNTGTVHMVQPPPEKKKATRKRVSVIRTPAGLEGVAEDIEDPDPTDLIAGA